MSRFRMSCHKLHIETGRYNSSSFRLKPEERLCIYCRDKQCEDESHFFINCSLYKQNRDKLFHLIFTIFPSFVNLEENDKMNFIMSCSNKEVINAVGKFISSSFLKRNSTNEIYTL